MAANTYNSSIMLRSSEDWESFWFALEGVAGSSNNSVFKLVDVYDDANLLNSPELPIVPQAPELPIRPDTTSNRNESDANQQYTLLLTEHKFRHAFYLEEKARVTKVLEKYDALNGWVRQHVHPDNYIYMRKEKSLFKQLLALKKQFSPTDRAKELRVIQLYNNARIYEDNQSVVKWLDNYQRAYDKALECDVPETTGYRAHYDFIHALKNIDMEYSKFLSFQLEKKRKVGKVSSMMDMINDFRNYQRQEEASRLIESRNHSESYQKGIAATFKEGVKENASDNKINYDDKQCLCGMKHAWSNCYYLNPLNRTSTWRGKKEIYDKINKQLRNPKMKWIIKKFGYDGMSKEKASYVTDKPSEVTNSFEETADYPVKKAAAIFSSKKVAINRMQRDMMTNQSKSKTVLTLDQNIANPTDDDFHLRDEWIIDNGADTHVTNSKLNFQETRKASSDGLLYAGKGAYEITSYGNVRLPLNSHIAGEYLLLLNVAYFPGFITNCVSLDKLSKANIHWSSKNPSILERTGDPLPFCHLYQSGSHWVFGKPQITTVLANNTKRTSMTRRVSKMTALKAHKVIGHAGFETIKQLEANCEGIEIDNHMSCPKTVDCETCACSKAHEIISRCQDMEFPAPSY